MAESKLTIAYWGVKGRAEVLRQLAEFVGLPYENKVYSDPNEWFGKDKPSLNTDFPNLPYIKDGDKIVTESEACAMYLVQKSKRLDLLGSNVDEVVQITQLKGVLTDTMNGLFKVAFNPEVDVQKGLEDNVTPKLTLLSKHLGNNEWLLGKLTLVDFFLVQLLGLLALQGEYLTKFPNLAAILQRFRELPALKAYLESDRNLKLPLLPPTKVNPNFKV